MENGFDIIKEVNRFEQWRKDNHTQEQYENGYTDDPSFPYWNKIDDGLENIFKGNSFHLLSEIEKNGIIYFIARSWDIGNILNWLHIKKSSDSISCIGLTENQFLSLCQNALNFEDDDAKCQFVKILTYIKEITEENRLALILKFYKNSGEYPKRLALYALSDLKYPKIEDLIEKSWTEIDDEFHKIGCLHVLEKIKSTQLKYYIKEAQKHINYPHLQEEVQILKTKNASR